MASPSFRTPLDLERVRTQFPTLQKCTYLNTGTYGLVPEPALQVSLAAIADFDRAGCALSANLGEIQERVRRRVAEHLNVDAAEIAITRNATDGNNLTLAGIDWRPGDEILTTDEEHPALRDPLLYLQKTRGIKVRFIPISPESNEMVRRVEEARTPRTRLVAMSHVPCETGTRLPAKAIAAWASEHGILSHFDGAQSWGAFPIDLKDIGCDFYAMNGHKWMCGPKGTGFFYARQERLVELSPAHVGAGSLEFADIESVRAEPFMDGRRFEFGSRGWGVLAGFDASLDWFESLGWPAVYEHIAGLSSYLKAQVSARSGFRLLTPAAPEQSSGLVSMAVDGFDMPDVATQLREKHRIYTRMVLGNTGMRLATSHFNSQADVDFLMEKLDEICRR